MRRTLVLAALLLFPSVATTEAADQFTYTMRREIHAVDAQSGAEIPFSSGEADGGKRSTLGVTGRVSIARRPLLVEEGGQIFVHATLPESLASRPQDLDVLIAGRDGMRQRGSIHFEPGQSRRLARLFVLPELEPGPALVEVQVRGVHIGDWQEIVSGDVVVPEKGRLSVGYSLEGAAKGASAIQVLVEARPAPGEKDFKPVTLVSERIAGDSSEWREESESLGKLEGKRVRFAFRSRPADGDATAAPGVLWGAPAIEVDEKRRAYPVIVVVSLDSLRSNSVGLYSGSNSTPFLDDFFGKRRGVVMRQAVTQSVTTLPAHLSLMTGLNPMSHGVIDETRSLGPQVATLAETLRDAGWNTAAFTEGGALAGELGFGRGFNLYDEGSSTEIDPKSSDAIERATRWVRDYSGAPLFLFVHSYATRPVHTGVNALANARARPEQLGIYVEQVRRADKLVEKLFGELEERSDRKRAIYVVLSGHGEEFFEHGAVGHGTQLYDEVMRVPLMLRSDGEIGETGDQQLAVGLIDLAPTLIDLADAKIPAGMQGRSFAKLLRSGDSVLPAPRFSEARRPVRLTSAGKLRLWGAPAYAVRDGSKKVIWNSASGDSFEAYDLATDAKEVNNLVRQGQAPEWARRLSTSLRAYPATAGRQARPGGKAELSPANRSRLESLGYAR